MNIEASEIKSIDIIGHLYQDDVKMIITKGGLHVFVGKRTPYSKKMEALSASSHPALGLHAIEKTYQGLFQPVLMKSEDGQPVIKPIVNDYTKYLPTNLKNNGIEVYEIKKSNEVDVVIYKCGLVLGEYNAEIINNELLVKSHDLKYIKPSKELADTLAMVLKDIQVNNKLEKITV